MTTDGKPTEEPRAQARRESRQEMVREADTARERLIRTIQELEERRRETERRWPSRVQALAIGAGALVAAAVVAWALGRRPRA